MLSLARTHPFLKAAAQTREQDHYQPDIYMWSHFLADCFQFASYSGTKCCCLEGLVTILDRFGSHATKSHLYRTITSIEDPTYMQYLAERLREIGREDIAGLLDGVPEERALDLDALVRSISR